MNRRSIASRAALLLGVLLSIGACKSAGPSFEKMVGPNGDTVSGAGATLVIPAGALAQGVTIAITRLDDVSAANLPAPAAPLGGATPERMSDLFELTPHGTAFSTPASFAFPARSGANLVMRLDDRADSSWERVDGAVFADGQASFETSRFSIYGAFRIDDPGTACERARCGANEIRSCSSNGSVACWTSPNGLTLAPEFGFNKYTQLTTASGVDLDTPDAAPYAAFLTVGDGSFSSPPAKLVFSFLPLKADVGLRDLITTEPFSLTTPLPSGGPSTLNVRAIFPVDAPATGYLVIGSARPAFYADRPLVLFVQPGPTDRWQVKEVVPQLNSPGPYGWTSWLDFKLLGTAVFAARQGNSIHIIADLNEPSAQTRGTTHRFTIPMSGFQASPGGALTVASTESSDAFPLDSAPHVLNRTGIGPGPGGTLALFSRGGRYVSATDKFIADMEVQLRNPNSGAVIARRSFQTAGNAVSGHKVSDLSLCNGGLFVHGTGHLDARKAVVSSTGSLDGVSALWGDQEDLVYVTAQSSGMGGLLRSECTAPLKLGSFATMLNARFEPEAGFKSFSTVWISGRSSEASAAFQHASSRDYATNTLTVTKIETPTSFDPTRLVVFGAVSTATGQRVFASGTLGTAGHRIFSLDVLNDGTFVNPLAVK